MKALVSILFNALILFAITFFIPYQDASVPGASTQNQGDTVKKEVAGTKSEKTGVKAEGGYRLFFIGGVVLGLLNLMVRPILKVLGFPFMILTFGLFILVINGVILLIFQWLMKKAGLEGIKFEIHGVLNFIIAVAIFTVFNTIYNTFLKK